MRVRDDEAVVVGNERDRSGQRGSEERAERADHRARERVGRNDDRTGYNEAESDCRPETRAAQQDGNRCERRRERPVEEDEVAIGQLPVGDASSRHEVVARVAVEVAPGAPGQREESEGEDGETRERKGVGRDGDPKPLGPDANRCNRRGHAAAASRPADSSRLRIPGTTRSVTPMVAWPLEISG